MVSEADDDTESKRPKRSSSARPKKSKKPKPPIPQTESEIDAPDRLTLVVLGFMGVVTLVLWGFARGACNYHPPRETRRPRPVNIEQSGVASVRSGPSLTTTGPETPRCPEPRLVWRCVIGRTRPTRRRLTEA